MPFLLTVYMVTCYFNVPARHTVLVPFGMDDHFFYPNGLLRSLLPVHVMLSKNHPVCVESGEYDMKMIAALFTWSSCFLIH